MVTVSIVAIAYSIRYGNAKMELVKFELGVTAGVAGLDAAGVGGRNESVADRAGDGIVMLCGVGGIATRGEGAMIGEIVAEGGVCFTGDVVVISGLCDGRVLGSAISMSTALSSPLSTVTVLGSEEASPSLTPERSS